MMISSRHLSRQRLSPLAHLANVSILWPIWQCLALLPGTPIVCGTNTPSPSPSQSRVASDETLRWVPRPTLHPELHSELELELEVEPQPVPRLAPPLLPRPSICKLRAGNVTCAAKTQFRCTDIDLPHKKTVPQTVAQVQITLQRSARVANSSTGAGVGGGKGLPYRIHTHGRLSRSRCLLCMCSTLGCVLIHSF